MMNVPHTDPRTHRWAMGRLLLTAAVVVGAAIGHVATFSTPVRAAATVDGAGSTWSQIAVDQWRADVARQGIVVNYQGVGSTAGRVAYYQSQVDFAVSEIPFQPALVDRNGNVIADETQLAAKRPYAYLPIVAGGTAFMYNLSVAGKRVTDLQLAPSTVAKIFNGQIKNWNDPAITADNPGKVLPATRIKPVIRSDGSGTSAQFTAYMQSEAPNEWAFLCQAANLGSGCAPTSLYPDYPNSGFAAQQFSDGVANFVAAPYNDGAITYVEYGYAKERGFPVASVRNVAGVYTQPSAVNVSIALQGARINPDGTQILSGVYRFADPRTYPVSSYSYMIVPTTTAAPFSNEKGDALSRFVLYFVCAGQQKSEQLGYSPLPRNLVQLAFDGVRRIPGAVTPPSIDTCSNPTITGQFITPTPTTPPATTAPTTAPPTTQPGGQPVATQPGGQPVATQPGGQPVATQPGGQPVATQPGGQPVITQPGTGGSGGNGGGNAAGDTEVPAANTNPQGQSVDAAGNVIDPVTGAPTPVGFETATDPVTGAPLLATAVAVTLPEEPGRGVPAIVYVVIAIMLFAAVFAPPVVASRIRARSGTTP
jgi:phosphate transport system substrate-binding protein